VAHRKAFSSPAADASTRPVLIGRSGWHSYFVLLLLFISRSSNQPSPGVMVATCNIKMVVLPVSRTSSKIQKRAKPRREEFSVAPLARQLSRSPSSFSVATSTSNSSSGSSSGTSALSWGDVMARDVGARHRSFTTVAVAERLPRSAFENEEIC
jgi:small neutral amino acid transporter SnatA (MarC family)